MIHTVRIDVSDCDPVIGKVDFDDEGTTYGLDIGAELLWVNEADLNRVIRLLHRLKQIKKEEKII
jgi:hypothetical protein